MRFKVHHDVCSRPGVFFLSTLVLPLLRTRRLRRTARRGGKCSEGNRSSSQAGVGSCYKTWPKFFWLCYLYLKVCFNPESLYKALLCMIFVMPMMPIPYFFYDLMAVANVGCMFRRRLRRVPPSPSLPSWAREGGGGGREGESPSAWLWRWWGHSRAPARRRFGRTGGGGPFSFRTCVPLPYPSLKSARYADVSQAPGSRRSCRRTRR